MFAITCSRIARLVFIASFVLLMAFCALSLLKSDITSASSNGNRPASSLHVQVDMPLTTPTPVCAPGVIVPSPNVGVGWDQLSAIDALDSDDIWSVGSYADQNNVQRTLTEHWNGATWTIQPSPNADPQFNGLVDVAVVSTDDVWAVGYSGQYPTTTTLTEHWDGTSWTLIPSPNVAGHGSALAGVAAVSANDIWAVGSYFQSGNTYRSLVLRWDGTSWSIIPTTNIDSHNCRLRSVALSASNDVWAVGYTTGGLNFGCSVHWDGSSWSYVGVPNPDPTINILSDVTEISSDNAWAVGYSGGTITPAQTLVIHWDGTQWSLVPSPNEEPGNNALYSISAAGAGNVWAVGEYRISQNVARPLVIRWDGTQWSVVPTPLTPSGGDNLQAVRALPPDQAWVVGFSGAGQTLTERYSNPCVTPMPTVTATKTGTTTRTPTSTPTFQPPPCPDERFTDVCPSDYFYTATLALADDGILSGYNTAPPCNNSLWIPCFNPYNNVTRGQASKIVSLAADFNDPVTGQMFEDVPPGSTFYTYTERMAVRFIIVGYPCGGPNEPCIPPDNRAYFRPNNNLTRGQMAKIVALSFGWNDPPVGQDFEDVLPGATFYTYTAQLYIRNIIGGYPCGGPGEPCIPPDDLPYYRPNNNVIRGQTAKIVQLARIQPTVTPVPTNTQTPIQSTQTDTPTALTSTATATPTKTWTPWPTPTFCLGNYSVGMGTANIDPGTTLVPGSNCDDCVSTVALPWPFRFYDLTFTTAYVSSNGNIQFVSSAADPTNACLPYAPLNYAIMPHWDDQLLTGPGQGIYTSVSGSAPFRRFNIEWRGTYAGGVGNLDYEVQLLENSYYGQINFVYGTVTDGGSGATVGLQRDTGSLHTEYECNTGGLTAGRVLYYIVPPSSCVTPSVTATPTNTRTPTITPTGTLPTATHTNTRTPFVTRTNTPTATYTGTPTSPTR